jgi:hypothetical protein
VLVRGALIVACIAAVVFLAGRLHQQRRCDGAQRALFALAVRGQTPPGGVPATLTRLRGSCRGGDALAAASGALALARRPALALGVAREAVRREPRDFAAWVALSQALAGRDPAAAARAAARAKALNPRWPGPAAPR